MYGKILSSPLKPVTTCGESSISAVWQGFEFTFLWIVFRKLFSICLLNLINIFHHISVLCTVISTWPYFQHICLITKIIIYFLAMCFYRLRQPDNETWSVNRIMKLLNSFMIEYNKKIIFFKNYRANETGRLVPDFFLFFKKLKLGKSKRSAA